MEALRALVIVLVQTSPSALCLFPAPQKCRSLGCVHAVDYPGPWGTRLAVPSAFPICVDWEGCGVSSWSPGGTAGRTAAASSCCPPLCSSETCEAPCLWGCSRLVCMLLGPPRQVVPLPEPQASGPEFLESESHLKVMLS